MKTLLLISFITLSGCQQNISEVGKHYCRNGVSEYRMEVFSGAHKGSRDTGTNAATDLYLEITANNQFGVHYKINGFPQGTPDINYQKSGNNLFGSDTTEEVVSDPSNNKKWIRQRTDELNIEISSGELKRTLTENHLDIKKNVTSSESYQLKAICN